jgi:phytoene dehydrogenase-like protein
LKGDIEMKEVIIIGSGIGGLVAGNLLAQKGHKVTVFEAHSTPGGYTAGFYRKGYYFESGTLSFESSASVFKAMKDIGVLEKIDFVKQKLRIISEEFDGIPENHLEYKKMRYSGFQSEKERPGAIFPDMEKMMFDDYWTVKSGMQSWADILAGNFKRLGGDLRLNSYVDKILTKNNAAVGVLCGNTVYNADYVISAGDYKKTLLKLLDNKSLMSREQQERISRAAVSEGFVTVYLGLDMSNEELGKYMKVPHVYILDNKPGYDIYNSDDGEFFSRISPSLYSPSLMNPKHAPDGKSSLMLQTTVPYHWMNNWGGGNKEIYGQLKKKAMDAMIDSVSGLIPGLKERIEYKDAATPLTYERFTHNTDGASSSFSWNPKKKFYPSTMGVNIETPVKNLYIGSCWAMQIGGVPGALAAAYQCAKKIR